MTFAGFCGQTSKPRQREIMTFIFSICAEKLWSIKFILSLSRWSFIVRCYFAKMKEENNKNDCSSSRVHNDMPSDFTLSADKLFRMFHVGMSHA